MRLRQLAASAKAAADAEDSVDTGAENDAPARDPASLQRVELVQVTSGEMEKATPLLISAAEVHSCECVKIQHYSCFSLHILFYKKL